MAEVLHEIPMGVSHIDVLFAQEGGLANGTHPIDSAT
jgi:hypothetical protein